MSDPRRDRGRDPHIAMETRQELVAEPRTESTSQTSEAEPSRREAMERPLMELSVWLSENPKKMQKNLKAVRRQVVLDPGVYYNSGIRMIERLYDPQHVPLGHKIFHINSDPAAPVAEIRRRVLEGKR